MWRAGEEHSTKRAQSVREQEEVGCGQSGGGGGAGGRVGCEAGRGLQAGRVGSTLESWLHLPQLNISLPMSQ